jgi:hypothetical protein
MEGVSPEEIVLLTEEIVQVDLVVVVPAEVGSVVVVLQAVASEEDIPAAVAVVCISEAEENNRNKSKN